MHSVMINLVKIYVDQNVECKYVTPRSDLTNANFLLPFKILTG